MDNNYFARLNQINVSDHIERKGEFAYLSWPYAVAQLRLADPTAIWEVRRFEGLPFLKTEPDYFGVTALTELSSHAASRAITSLEKQRRAA